MCPVVFMGLLASQHGSNGPQLQALDNYIAAAQAVEKAMGSLTNGSPQYVQLQI
jgi:hypothetical protein